ncbi:hypothetical protein PHJA_000089300 [Phtheirospermum japonicum]|uniref:Uncharacterized protein n=1 Tax=Phtheirospermum japonicum TaxID=374723 RepID=A0A830B3D2_9LAMI|nr:hypothetical protein PHJA_000089300 [Phtheirospermum japonicum]
MLISTAALGKVDRSLEVPEAISTLSKRTQASAVKNGGQFILTSVYKQPPLKLKHSTTVLREPPSKLSTRKRNHHHPLQPFPVDAVARPIIAKVIVAVDPLLPNNGFSYTQVQHGDGRRSCVVVMDEGDVRLEAVNGLNNAVICWFEFRVACLGCGTCRNRYRLAGARSNGVDTTLAIGALCDGTE